MANTYDWIIETADSNNRRIIWVIIRIHNNEVTSEEPVLPRSVINKWPAIILAVSRTARVPGRIIFLIVSMQTIKGIKTPGVPCGTKWQNIFCVLFIHP